MSEAHAEQVETPVEHLNPVDEAAQLLEAALMGEEPEAEQEQPEIEPELELQQDLSGESPEAEAEAEAEPEDESPVIDYDLEVPMPEGREAMTVGQLKDAVVKAEREAQAVIDSQNEIMRERDELRQLIAAAGESVSPQVREAQAAKMKQHLEREHQAMLDAIPEWKEESTFRAERQEIVDLGAEYGFTADDIGQIADHRAVKMLRDYARLKKTRAQNVEQFEKAAKPKPKRKPQTQSKTAGRDARYKAAQTGGVGQKVAAIEELLTG